MNQERCDQVISGLRVIATIVNILPLEEFIQEAEREETLAPMLDPTAYIKSGAKLTDIKSLAKALLPFQKETIKQHRKEEAKKAESSGVIPRDLDILPMDADQ